LQLLIVSLVVDVTYVMCSHRLCVASETRIELVTSTRNHTWPMCKYAHAQR